MELTKIIIVSLSIAAASSTPHGYGIKDGASAKSGAVAGAVAFPGVLPDFGGAGGGSFSSSGSFSKASSSSFASSSAGAFSYSGSGGYGSSAPGAGGAQGQYGDGTATGGAGAGAAANANAAAFAGALAGNTGHGAGYTPGQPCSGNCASSDEQKQRQPDCQGSDCGSNSNLPKCTSGVCDANVSPSSQSYGLAPGQHSGPNQSTQHHSVETHDDHDRPGKIDISGFHDEHNKSPPGNVNLPENQPTQYGQPCTSPACGSSHSTPCNTPGCDNSPHSGNKLCTSPAGCDQPVPSSGPSTSYNSGPPANAGAGTYGHSPQFNPGYTPTVNQKPVYHSSSSDSKSSQYGGSFGGPPGILKPNDYTVPDKSGYSPQHGFPTHGVAPAGTPNGPHGGVPSQPAIHDQPPHLPSPSFPPASAGSTPSVSYVPPNKGQKPSSSQHGNSAYPNYTGSGAFAGAAAGAQAAAYTGGFGGPPGILKPNDFGLHGVKPAGFGRPHSDKGTIGLPHHSGTLPGGVLTQGKHPAPGAVHDNTPYQGSFGGAPGVVRPNGPLGTGTFPSTQPQSKPEYNVPGKPASGCGPGSVCSGAYPGEQPHEKPQHIFPGKPSNVYPGPEAGQYDSSYQGGFGGATGGIRPSGPIGTGTFPSTQPHNIPEYNAPGKPGSGCGPSSGSLCSGAYPSEQPHGKPQDIFPGKPSVGQDESPYQGGFGGAPGVVRPNGPIGTGPFPSTQSKPEYNVPEKPISGCGPGSACSGAYPGEQPDGKPQHIFPGKPSSIYPSSGAGGDNSPYQGGFGGAPGAIRPNGPIRTGVFTQDKLEHISPEKPVFGCDLNSGSACSDSYHGQQDSYHGQQPESKPQGQSSQHSGEPGAGCGPGVECNSHSPDLGTFGGTPGVIGGAGAYPTHHLAKPESSYPRQSYLETLTPIYPSTGNTAIASGSGSPASSAVGSGAFAGAAAGAAAGAVGGHGGHIGQGYGGGAPGAGNRAGIGVPGSLAFAGASAGAAAGTYGGHSGHAGDGGYGGLGTLGASGGYGGYPNNGGFVKNCGAECAGDGGIKGGNEVNSYGGLNGGFGLNLGGALAAAKSVVGSFGLLGSGAGAAGAGAGAGAGSAGGSFGLGGSFASAQASAGAKSYGGYH